MRNVFFKVFFAIVGILFFGKIINNYGIERITDEVTCSGPLLILIIFTFIPTIICYAISWLLITEHQKMLENNSFVKKIFIFSKITIASIAWNNLTPFLKVGGEPLKYLMLSKYLSKQEALFSTINYNIIHLFSTSICFIFAATTLLVFYNIPNEIQIYLLDTVIVFSFSICFAIWFMKSKLIQHTGLYKYKLVKVVIVNFKSAHRRLFKLYALNPKIFFISLFFDVFARFIEGLTFFFGFYIIKSQISFLNSSLLEVGRTFVDTLFFFVPYQVGTREEGVRLFMEKIFLIDSKGFLTVVLLYRFVEVFWILIGYLIWLSTKSSSRETKV